MTSGEGYRRDIDGLRAVAVLAIVIHHAFPALLPGGFVGVDVFFVISGFLITRIIAGQRDAGTFSWGGFYLRRARRIVPAYVVALLGTAGLATWIEMPRLLAQTGAATAASGLFVANLLFAQTAGYFSPAAQQNPLLHLWSLGVEEQFYLVWPLLIAGLSLRWWRGARPWLAAVLLILSLVLAQLMVGQGGSAWAFFGLPARTWEFLLGAVVSLDAARAPAKAAAANLAADLGLALIAGTLALLTDAAPFPGLTAVPAALGAAMVLWSGQGCEPAASVILRTGPAVAVGRVSYSLYLWHWPLLVLAADVAQAPLNAWARGGLMLLALGPAALSWRLIEQPFRRGPVDRPWRRLAATLSPLLLVIGAGALLFFTHGLPGRLSPSARAAAALEEGDVNPLRKTCFEHRGPVAPTGCRIGAAPDALDYDVLVWGDSHADAVTPGVVAWARARGWSVREAAQGGCPPLVNLRVRLPNGLELKCPSAADQAMGEIAANRRLKLVVLAARWPLYRDAPPFYDVNSPRTRIEARDAPGARPALAASLGATLDAIRVRNPRARVLIIGPVPELTFTPPECLAQARHLHLREAGCFSAPVALPLARARPAEAEIRAALNGRPNVRALFPTTRLCGPATCASALDGRLIYFDDDHLSASGAEKLVPRWMDEALAGVPTAPASGIPHAGSTSPGGR
ncbi:acyltransferase family protein [Caulobacter sp. LARHSG274]